MCSTYVLVVLTTKLKKYAFGFEFPRGSDYIVLREYQRLTDVNNACKSGNAAVIGAIGPSVMFAFGGNAA